MSPFKAELPNISKNPPTYASSGRFKAAKLAFAFATLGLITKPPATRVRAGNEMMVTTELLPAMLTAPPTLVMQLAFMSESVVVTIVILAAKLQVVNPAAVVTSAQVAQMRRQVDDDVAAIVVE